jgi:ribosomal protein S18 acetylase RimI-like enzyme
MDDLHARLLPGYFRRPPGPPRSRAEVERIVNAVDEILRVAVSEDDIVGLCHLQLYDTPPLPAMTPCRRAHLDSLVVEPGARRRGIGRRLVEDAASWGQARGASEIVLTVWAGNAEADRFYEALGFGTVNRVLGKRL